MGTPIRLEDVSSRSVPPSESCMIGRIALGGTQPHLKYLANYVVFGEYLLDYPTTDKMKRVTNHDLFDGVVSPLPEDFEGNDRCFPLLITAHRRWVAHERFEYIYRQELLLAVNGNLIVWDWLGLVLEDKEHPTEFAVRSKLRILRGRTLEKWLSRPILVLAMIRALATVVVETLEERRKRLESMESLKSLLGEFNVHLS